MAYLYVDDGCPEGDDYASNYIYFDENNPQSLQRALQIAGSRKANLTNSDNHSRLQTGSFPAFTSQRSAKII